MIKSLLVAVDASAYAQAGLEHAVALAQSVPRPASPA